MRVSGRECVCAKQDRKVEWREVKDGTIQHCKKSFKQTFIAELGLWKHLRIEEDEKRAMSKIKIEKNGCENAITIKSARQNTYCTTTRTTKKTTLQ